MKILLTGNEGYIGSKLEQKLKEKGYEIEGVDLASQDPMDIRYIKDINADAVVHLAGISHEPTAQYDPKKTDEINHKATERLAKIAKKAGIKKFIFSSTCSIYFTFNSPLYPKYSKETDIVNPISAYSLSKRAAEQSLLALNWHKFEPVIFRFGTVYGKSPNMRTDTVVHHFINDIKKRENLKVFADGHIYRPLTDIEDVCWGIIKAIETPNIGGEIFNLATKNWNVKDLADEIVKISGISEERVETKPFGLTRNYLASTSKIKKVLGFKPQRKFKKAICELL